MPYTYFISDVHLGGNSPKLEKTKEKKLLSFLDHVSTTGERLFIVGDLFDFWFEYRTVVPRGYTRVLCALSNLHELGIELYYIAGNHDFWMRDFLQEELGFRIYFDCVDIVIQNKRFFIHHGDGISRKDVGYRILKRIFRNRFNIAMYRLLHPDVGIPLAKWVSALSRNHTLKQGIPDDSDYVKQALQLFEQGYDYVIYGHLHTPIYQIFGEKIYLNLGDWIQHFTFALFDGEMISLQQWQ